MNTRETEFARGRQAVDVALSDSASLNANCNPQHWSYKVLGTLTWSALIFCFISLILAPRLLLDVARVMAIYMMVRLISLTMFYLVGLVRIARAQHQARANSYLCLSSPQTPLHAGVHHLVILLNFDEPLDILSRTLESLSLQEGARDHIAVVLAMEEREVGARVKAEILTREYEGKFCRLSATYHPSDLPGEIPGKGTNETWAVRCARREMVEELGLPAGRIVVTVADSDSIIHPFYLSELSRQFTADPRRYSLIWQTPLLFDNDIWQTHAVIRLITFYSNVVATGDFVNSWEPRFPYSTYSISLQLLEDVGYWDPAIVAEDVNIFSRAFFRKGGQAFVQRIYLPTHGNPTYGANLRHAMGIYYAQKVRHGWGGAEIGYLFQKWNYPPGTPLVHKVGRLLKLIHDHLFFSTAGIVVTLGVIVSIALDRTAAITMPSVSSAAFILLNLLGGASLLAAWLSERLRVSRGRADWQVRTLVSEAVLWLFLPILLLLLVNLPTLQAQTGMLLGRPFAFRRTPKGFHAKIDD